MRAASRGRRASACWASASWNKGSASSGSAVIARPKATVARAHGRRVASANSRQLVGPATGQVGLVGADGRLDALRGRHARQHREPEPAEVVQGPDVVSGAGGLGSLGPTGQVVHGVGQDAQGVGRGELLEPEQERVVVVSVLERPRAGSARRPAGRSARAGRCPRQRDGLLGAAPNGDVVAGEVVSRSTASAGSRRPP